MRWMDKMSFDIKVCLVSNSNICRKLLGHGSNLIFLAYSQANGTTCNSFWSVWLKHPGSESIRASYSSNQKSTLSCTCACAPWMELLIYTKEHRHSDQPNPLLTAALAYSTRTVKRRTAACCTSMGKKKNHKWVCFYYTANKLNGELI